MKAGTYVLATKYKDGDPCDHWFVGFYKGSWYNGSSKRHGVVDGKGVLVRYNGFRRVQKITKEEGNHLIKNKDNMILAKSVWHVLRLFRKEAKLQIGE